MTKPRSLERGFYLGQTDKLAQHRETVRCASRASEHRAGRPSFGPFFWCQKKYQKAPGPGPHKNHFQAGNFITRAGFAPHSNNKISNPLGRLFIDGAPRQKRKRQKRQQQRPRPRPRQQPRQQRTTTYAETTTTATAKAETASFLFVVFGAL